MSSMSTIESRDERRKANLAHPNFATFSHTTLGRLLSPISLKCASNEHRVVLGTRRIIFSRPPIWAVGAPLSGSLGWGHFSTYPISESFDPQKTKYHLKQGDLQDYLFLLLGEAPGGLRANLAHPNFATCG